jgi:hypothetical protein
MTTPTITLNGAVLAAAERATRAVLDRVLAKAGTSFHDYIAMTVTATQGGTVDRDQLVQRMVAGLKEDELAVRAAIGAAEFGGLLRADGTDEAITDQGRALYGRLSETLTEVTSRLYADLPARDLAVAGRVLTILTERANAELDT